jgi:hypothetical protein
MEPVEEHLVSLISPAAFEAEQYRALRHIVEQMRKAANIQVVAVYMGNAPEMATDVAPNDNSIQIDVHFTFEIPEFGAEWGLLVAGLAVGAVAVVAVVWRRKQ